MLFRAIPLVKAINLKEHTLLRWLLGRKMCVCVMRRGAGGGGWAGGKKKHILHSLCSTISYAFFEKPPLPALLPFTLCCDTLNGSCHSRPSRGF